LQLPAKGSEPAAAVRREAAASSASNVIGVIDSVCHDIRTPLSVVHEFASLTLEGAFEADPRAQTRAVRLIVEQVSRIELLLASLENLVRQAAGALDECAESAEPGSHADGP